jgi:antitoxin component of RelBE/YafQ-DinJ toxin-antitoxin module
MSTRTVSARTQRITLDVPAAQHKKIKTIASMMDLSIKDLMLMSFEEFMHKKYNKVTEKAIKQTLAGKDVKKFKTLDDLIEDLED